MAWQVILVQSYLDQVNEYIHRLDGPLGKGIPHHDIMLVEIGSNDVRARVWQYRPSAALWFAHYAALQCVLAAAWPDLTSPRCKATACSHIETHGNARHGSCNECESSEHGCCCARWSMARPIPDEQLSPGDRRSLPACLGHFRQTSRTLAALPTG